MRFTANNEVPVFVEVPLQSKKNPKKIQINSRLIRPKVSRVFLVTRILKSRQMKIKRKFEMLVATNRRYIIRQSPSGEQIACAECGEPMLRVEQAAGFFGVKQRRIFQIIETEAVHFTEIESSAAMICLPSLAAVLDGEARENQSLKTNGN